MGRSCTRLSVAGSSTCSTPSLPDTNPYPSPRTSAVDKSRSKFRLASQLAGVYVLASVNMPPLRVRRPTELQRFVGPHGGQVPSGQKRHLESQTPPSGPASG